MQIDKNNSSQLKEIILEHYQYPQYQTTDLKLSQSFFNSSCGDEIRFQLLVVDDLIQDLAFSGKGCALCLAATDILCGQIIGQHLTTSLEILTNFYHLITQQQCNEDQLGELLAFWTVPQHPNRIGCVLLGANGLKEMILVEKGKEK